MSAAGRTKSSARQYRVYCAGPLFNRSERAEMEAIAEGLVKAGYGVYLPHRDGMEFRLVLDVLVERGWPRDEAGQFLHEAIFALDVYQLAIECDAVVWNLNGRTPDEGAVSEAAIAWTLGKPLLAYRDDARSLIAGRVNPLLVGLVGFETIDDLAAVPNRLSELLIDQGPFRQDLEQFSPRLALACENGRRLWQTLRDRHAQFCDEMIADVVAELFGHRERSKV